MDENTVSHQDNSLKEDASQKSESHKLVEYALESTKGEQSSQSVYQLSTETARSSSIEMVITPAKPAILMHSIADANQVSDSWSEEEYDSTELEVDYETEDEEMDDHVVLARLTRLGNFRGIWKNSLEYYAVSLAFLISPDAIVSAIYGFRKFGAGILTPTMLGMWFLAIPLMFLELSLGQYTSSTLASVFQYAAPAFSAIAVLSMLMNFIVTLNDFQLIAMTMSVLKDILRTKSKQLKAAICFNSWNNIACKRALDQCAQISAETGISYVSIQGRCVQERWYTDLLQKDMQEKHSFRELTPQWDYFITYLTGTAVDGTAVENYPCTQILVFLSCTFVVLFHIQIFPHRLIVHLSKLPMFMIFVFFSTVLLCSYFNPEIDRIGFPIKNEPIEWLDTDFQCWLIGHIFYVSKIGQGSLITLGSQNPFRCKLFKHTFIMAVVAFTIPHLFAYLIYPYMDKLLWNYLRDFNKFQESRSEFFAIYNRAFITIWTDALLAFYTDENNGKLLGTLFIFTILVIFLVHKIIRLRTLVKPILEYYNITTFADLSAIRRAVLFIVYLLFFNNMLTPHRTTSFFSTVAGCIAIVVFELICFFNFYGPRRLICTLNMMFGVFKSSGNIRTLRLRESYNLLLMVIFGIIAVAIGPYLLVLFFLYTYQYINIVGNYGFAFVIMFIFGLTVPLHATYKVLRKYLKKQLVVNLFKPVPMLWGPREKHDRIRAEYQERQMRIG